MKKFCHILLMSLFTLAAAPASARAEPSREALIAQLGLGGGAACLHYVDAVAVDYRKERWLLAIERMWKLHPDYVLDWIVGATEPPEAVVAEAKRQRDCLFERLVHDAARDDTTVIVDWQRERATKAQMPELRERYEASSTFARRVIDALTESHYRDAPTQSWIWKRKFVFSGRNFNYISHRAADRCGLTAGQSWKPDARSHQMCWEDELTAEEREQEILQASSAPGISRHHWGTEFDFFGLNPMVFRTGRHADEYLWMTKHALEFGFFQPYAATTTAEHRYMEERWHWSYYPVSQALLEFAAAHTNEVGEALEAQWTGFEARWNVGRRAPLAFFGFVRQHWKDFVFNIDDAVVSTRPPAPR